MITAASDERWIAALRSLTQRGVKAAVIELDHESFGGRAGAQEAEGALRAAGVDDLSISRATGWLDAPGLSVQAAAAAIHAASRLCTFHSGSVKRFV